MKYLDIESSLNWYCPIKEVDSKESSLYDGCSQLSRFAVQVLFWNGKVDSTRLDYYMLEQVDL